MEPRLSKSRERNERTNKSDNLFYGNHWHPDFWYCLHHNTLEANLIGWRIRRAKWKEKEMSIFNAFWNFIESFQRVFLNNKLIKKPIEVFGKPLNNNGHWEYPTYTRWVWRWQ